MEAEQINKLNIIDRYKTELEDKPNQNLALFEIMWSLLLLITGTIEDK